MKIKEGFILRTVAGETVALPTGGVADLDMMITLNDTGRFIWEQLGEDREVEDVVKAMMAEYDVDEQTARSSTDLFVKRLKELDFLA